MLPAVPLRLVSTMRGASHRALSLWTYTRHSQLPPVGAGDPQLLCKFVFKLRGNASRMLHYVSLDAHPSLGKKLTSEFSSW